MSSPVNNPGFWFQALINRNGVYVQRQGTIVDAEYPYQALGNLRKMAEEWGSPIVEAAIYEINTDGEVGRQMLKTDSAGRTEWTGNHTCDRKPTPAPWEFGTYMAQTNFKVFNMEDT